MTFEPLTERVDAIPTKQATFKLTNYDGYYTSEVYGELTVRWHITELWTGGEGIIATDRFDIMVGTDADRGSLKIIKGAGRPFVPMLMSNRSWLLFIQPQPTYFNVTTGEIDLDVSIDSDGDLLMTGIPDAWLV